MSENENAFSETIFAIKLPDGSFRYSSKWQTFLEFQGAVVGEYRFYGVGKMANGEGKARPELKLVKGLNI